MFFTLIVAAIVALVWTVLSSLADASGRLLPRDPTTLELLLMAVMTLAAYSWANRFRVVHDEPMMMPTEVSEFDFSERADELGEDATEHAA